VRVKVTQDLWNRFSSYVQSNQSVSVSAAARAFGLPVSTAHRIIAKRAEGWTAPESRKRGHKPLKITQPATLAIARWVDERPDLTLLQLCRRLSEEYSIQVTPKTMSTTLTRIGYTIKILRSIPISRNCPDVIQARREYAQMFLNNAPADQRLIIWTDESGFNLHLRRKFGRARRGALASVTVPNNRGSNISVCAAMSEEGLLHEKLSPRPYTAELFCEYLDELFIELRRLGRAACWIILDNARFHHCAVVNECVTRNGHSLVFLPAYSPMLNPIESLFGKWKTLIQTQGVSYTQDELLAHMAIARYEISIPDCLGWIRDVGRNIGLSLTNHIFE
jgi:transposase